MPVRILVCLLLALTGCTTGSSSPSAVSGSSTPTPSVAASPLRTASPSVTPAPVAEPLLVAVADKRGGLSLYRVTPGAAAAVRLRTLDGPAHDVAVAVSLSGGTSPTVCAVWRPAQDGSKAPVELRCYPPGASRGRVVSLDVNFHVGVRADGRAIAWTEGGQYLVIADLAGDVAKVRSRMLYAEHAPEGSYPEALGDLDWIGPRTLVGTAVGDSDESVGLCVIDLDHPRRQGDVGFGRCLTPRGVEADRGNAHFDEAALVAPGQAVVIERGQNCCMENPGVPAGRVVRLRLSDGAVLGVVATPKPGRAVVDVSGGLRAVLYTTTLDGGDPVVSLRWASEAHGAPVTGLPSDLLLATAQP